MRDIYDRSSKWLIGHEAGAVLRLGGASGFTSWRTVQAEVVAPKKLPDGLLEVFYPASREPELYLVEMVTYPDRRAEEQVLEDVALVYLDRHRLPEVLTLVLCPRGQVRVEGRHDVESPRGWTRFGGRWRVVELWTVPAADLLAMNDVGLIPWVPLARWDGDPEALLRECRERIDRQAPPQQHENFLAVTAMLGSLRYNADMLRTIFGGGRAMIEFPLLKDLFSDPELLRHAPGLQQLLSDPETLRRAPAALLLQAEGRRRDIVRFLAARFGAIAPEVEAALAKVTDAAKLDELIDWAARCPDLDAFRTRLPT